MSARSLRTAAATDTFSSFGESPKLLEGMLHETAKIHLRRREEARMRVALRALVDDAIANHEKYAQSGAPSVDQALLHLLLQEREFAVQMQERQARARELLETVVRCAKEDIHVGATSPVVLLARTWLAEDVEEE